MSDNAVIRTLPARDGYIMPGEFEPHMGTVIIWPERPGSWNYGARDARVAFARLINGISAFEKVYVIVNERTAGSALKMLSGNTELVMIDTNDAWARDISPTFVRNAASGGIAAVNWSFNAWGGAYDGLYSDYAKDDAFAAAFAAHIGCPVYDAHPFVLEGGSVHSDGEGTLLTSESCLLSPGRNPELTKGEIEEKLREYTGASKIIWISDGIYNDETNGHIDNMAAFTAPGHIVLAWCDNPEDPQYAKSHRALEQLRSQTDAKGRHFTISKLPIPAHPVCVTEQQLAGYEFEEGEDTREAGERLAASYVNFYFANGALFLPQFGGENVRSDREALEIITKLCPGRRVIPVDSSAILLGGGNIHCVTSQIPAILHARKVI